MPITKLIVDVFHDEPITPAMLSSIKEAIVDGVEITWDALESRTPKVEVYPWS